jgi:hypothetical protein
LRVWYSSLVQHATSISKYAGESCRSLMSPSSTEGASVDASATINCSLLGVPTVAKTENVQWLVSLAMRGENIVCGGSATWREARSACDRSDCQEATAKMTTAAIHVQRHAVHNRQLRSPARLGSVGTSSSTTWCWCCTTPFAVVPSHRAHASRSIVWGGAPRRVMAPPLLRYSDPTAVTGGSTREWKGPLLRGRCGGAALPISLSTSENRRLMVAVS